MSFWNKLEKPVDAPAPLEVQSHAAQPAPARPAPEKESRPMAMKREELPASAGGPSDLLLGHGAEFDGKLTFSGTVRIDAKFKGSIQTDDVLVVGEHARIDADITCGTVIIYGEVNGNIRAKNAVELHHPAKLRGNVETPSLMLEKGVVFQGESRMEPERSAPVRPVPMASASTSAGAGAPAGV